MQSGKTGTFKGAAGFPEGARFAAHSKLETTDWYIQTPRPLAVTKRALMVSESIGYYVGCYG
jgi:hypothetical protein